MKKEKTATEWEETLGEQIKTLRLRHNLSQRELAERGDIALNAVKNIEAGRGGTLTSLMRILRTLEKTDWITTLTPEVSISPMQMIAAKAPRQRASKGHHV